MNKLHNFSAADREPNDFYATHPSATYPLFAVETFSFTILEPACGAGHMAEAIKDCGYSVIASDLVDRGYGSVQDFFEITETPFDIVTNPPFRRQEEFVEHAMDILPPRGKLALLLKIQYLEGLKRYELHRKLPPARVHVFSKRPRICKSGDFKNVGASTACFAWYVWEKGLVTNPVIDWICPMAEPPTTKWGQPCQSR